MTFSFDYSFFQWLSIILGASIIGISKAGVKGIDMLNITLMAIVFGSKASTGVVLPLLCVADILAVIYYKRNVQWNHFWRLIPPMIIGMLLAMWFGKDINEGLFKNLMIAIILSTIILMLYTEFKKNLKFPNSLYFSTFMGLVAGVTTMLGNLAGAFSNIYFLSLKLTKKEFIGTAAWVFLVINILKMPMQIFVWKNIDLETIKLDILLLPALLIGFYTGLKIVSKINEILFRRLIITLTLLGSVLIFLK